MTYTLHPGAELDLDEACRRYRKTASGLLIVRFLDELERVAKLLERAPGLGTAAGDERAAFPLHGFPYTVVYKPAGIGIRVLVILHKHRDPAHGEGRR